MNWYRFALRAGLPSATHRRVPLPRLHRPRLFEALESRELLACDLSVSHQFEASDHIEGMGAIQVQLRQTDSVSHEPSASAATSNASVSSERMLAVQQFRSVPTDQRWFTVSGSVGQANVHDLHRLSYTQPTELDLRLQPLQGDVDLYLLDDRGRVLARSFGGELSVESIRASLQPGTYYALVLPFAGSQSAYTLDGEAVLSVDQVGDLPTTAYGVPDESLAFEFMESVGGADRRDVFRVEVEKPTQLRIELDPRQADLDLYLIDEQYQVVDRSVLSAATGETIDATLLPGTYFVVVTPYQAAVGNYQLNLQRSLLSQHESSEPSSSGPLPEVPYYGDERDWAVNQVGAPEAWAAGYTGAGVVVAIVDTGVDLSHPELQSQIWVNPGEIPGNGRDDDRNGLVDDVSGWDFAHGDASPQDVHGHGTHVAGIVAAQADGTGSTGVAPHARILPVQVLDERGAGSDRSVAAGIRYAVEMGAQIINLSLGGLSSPRILDALTYAAQQDVLVVAAAGNSGGSEPLAPAIHSSHLPQVLSVGAHDREVAHAAFSHRVGDSGANQLDAPGVGIHSTLPGGYGSMSGTSMAAPFVSAVAALLWQARPELTAEQLASTLLGNSPAQATGSDAWGVVDARHALAVDSVEFVNASRRTQSSLSTANDVAAAWMSTSPGDAAALHRPSQPPTHDAEADGDQLSRSCQSHRWAPERGLEGRLGRTPVHHERDPASRAGGDVHRSQFNPLYHTLPVGQYEKSLDALYRSDLDWWYASSDET